MEYPDAYEFVKKAFSDVKISNCIKCHHEQYAISGKICDWCGGDMKEIK